MTRFKIPKSPKEVTKWLGEIDQLLTATEWKRAALVAAMVRLPGRGTRREEARTSFFTCEQFAELGIKGLRSKDTVRAYVQRWLDANMGEYPRLGASVTLPELEWPPEERALGSRVSADPVRAVQQVVEKHGPEAVAAAVVDTPVLDNAVSRTRLDRVSTPAERKAMAKQSSQRKAAMEQHIADNRAALADEIQHQADLELMGARMYLRRAVRALEQNPYTSPSQRDDRAVLIDECRYLLGLLGQDAETWNDNDRRFLEEIGVEGSTT